MSIRFELPPSLSVFGNEDTAFGILGRIWGKKGLFTCTIANTMTSVIPGVSDAGDTPELTLFTPAADAEMLVNKKVTCMKGIPVNPGGIPTPATLTMAALDLSNMPFHIVNGGMKVIPNIPMYDVGGEYGRDITTGNAVSNVRRAFDNGMILGELLSKGYDYLVISESCAGGTTTALAVMMAIGTINENLVSSSSPNNPKELKTELVAKALKAAGIRKGELKDDLLKAIECVGDPMMPVNVGMLIGAAKHVPVIVGGGTQMAAILAVATAMDDSIIGNVLQGTTRWLVDDPNSDICRIVSDIHKDIPIVYVNMDYSSSPYEGLQAYEWGYIKDGVGCGGASVAAIVQSSGRITCEDLLGKVHEVYREMMDQ